MITKIENVQVFDGYHLTDQKEVYFNSDGVFISPSDHADQVIDGKNGFLMPGLIDAHTHPTKEKNIKDFMKYGVTSTCAISAPENLKGFSDSTRIYSTYNMALGSSLNPQEFVQNEIRHGAKYIKIILEDKPRMAPDTMPQELINAIAEETHKNGLLLAVHAVSVPTLQMAISAGTDIHIHVPLEAEITQPMIDQIVKNGACCVPTLAMMKGFADGIFYGYHKSDYQNARMNAKHLYQAGVPILAGTDANNVLFLPTVKFGSALHKEMKLLKDAGLSNEDVLRSAACRAADGFQLKKIGAIKPGRYADFILIDGNPLQDLQDIDHITQVWIGGKRI